MTDEDIFNLAEDHGWQDDFGRWNFQDDGLLDFVFEIQKAEREACAKVCDSSIHDTYIVGETGAEHYARRKCAAAIRARGNHD